jgi:DNA polymerase III sliding clamp (beta) subunit (PCNA family)
LKLVVDCLKIPDDIGEIKQNNNLASQKTVILPRKAVSELNKILEKDGDANFVHVIGHEKNTSTYFSLFFFTD